jgi:glutamine synthetase adenylyltransferase
MVTLWRTYLEYSTVVPLQGVHRSPTKGKKEKRLRNIKRGWGGLLA